MYGRTACNYLDDAVEDDGSCEFAAEGFDCDGTWVEDITHGECNDFDSLNDDMEEDCLSNHGCSRNVS